LPGLAAYSGRKYLFGTSTSTSAYTQSARDLRFVFDTQDQKIVAMQVLLGTGYVDAMRGAMLDVEDSLLTANFEAFDNPDDFGLDFSDEMPDWARGASPDGPKPT
jgi:hypothetical protein